MANVLVGTTASGGAWAHLPADVYDATLDSYEEAPRGISQWNDDPDAVRLTINFRLDDLPQETLDFLSESMKADDPVENPITMKYWVNKVLSPKANLAPVLEALGIPWGPGIATDLDDMPGKRCRLVVGRKIPQGKTEEIAFVQSIVPAKAVTPNAPKRTAPAAAAPATLACCVPQCKREGVVFDAEGNAFCEKHRPDDDD